MGRRWNLKIKILQPSRTYAFIIFPGFDPLNYISYGNFCLTLNNMKQRIFFSPKSNCNEYKEHGIFLWNVNLSSALIIRFLCRAVGFCVWKRNVSLPLCIKTRKETSFHLLLANKLPLPLVNNEREVPPHHEGA